MKIISSIIVAMCLLMGFTGNTYSTNAEPQKPPTKVEPRRPAPAKPDPLAPLVAPKRDFWVGTITIKETRDIKHHREGKTNIAHAFMKGDGYFTSSDEFHRLYIATITIEPCPDRSKCWSRNSGKVHYILRSTQKSKDRQPILCRGWPNGKGYGKSSLKNEDNLQRSESADGQVKTFANVSLFWDDNEWHIKADVINDGLECKAVEDKYSMSDIGCGVKPETKKPGPQPDSCKLNNTGVSFSTGITDSAALRLHDTKSLEHIAASPDPKYKPSGTINEDRTVSYDLRRILEY